MMEDNPELADTIVECLVSDIDKFDYSDFEQAIYNRLEYAQASIEDSGMVNPVLTIVFESSKYTFIMPDNNDTVRDIIEYVKQNYKGIKSLFFVNEVWALKVHSENNLLDYAGNPSSVVENPMKDEAVSVFARGMGEEHIYHLAFSRDDYGNVVWGELTEIDSDQVILYDKIINSLKEIMV